MNKTLKILMAIILVVAMLGIATTVNAATATTDLEKLKEVNTDANGDPLTDASGNEVKAVSYDRDEEEYVFNVPFTAAKLGDNYKPLRVVKDATINLNGKAATEIQVASGAKVTIKTTNAATLTTLVVEDGTVTLEGSVTVKTVELEEKGNISVKDSSVVEKLVTDKSLTINKDSDSTKIQAIEVNKAGAVITLDKGIDAGKVVTPTLTSDVKVDYATVAEENGTQYFVPESEIKIGVRLLTVPEGKDIAGSKVEVDEEYAIDLVATYNGRNLVNGVVPKPSDAYSKKYISVSDVVSKPLTSNNDEYYVLSVDKKIENGNEVLLKLALRGTDVEREVRLASIPVEVKGDNEEVKPTPTTEVDNNKKDESPKTGDSIIPATAILAVVVIANVVYFAKVKRG